MMNKQYRNLGAALRALVWGGGLLIVSSNVSSAQVGHTLDMSTALEARVAVSRGVRYLQGQQSSRGDWSAHPGVTALCSIVLHRAVPDSDVTPSQLARARRYIVANATADGTFRRSEGDSARSYSTAVCMLALSMFGEPDDAAMIARARTYFLQTQPKLWVRRVSAGYRASNDDTFLLDTYWALEGMALSHAERRAAEDGAFWDKAIRFISRCQRLDLPENHPDYGCFIYWPMSSEDEATAVGRHIDGARGSYVCAGLKGLLYAGVPITDDRIQAGSAWLKRHIRVDENPRAGDVGFYSYIYLLSTACAMLEEASHDIAPRGWRQKLVEQLLSRQRRHGEWLNTSALWRENDANLCTAYAVLAIGMALGAAN